MKDLCSKRLTALAFTAALLGTLGCGVAHLSPPSGATAISFSNSSNPSTNPFPQSIAVADFNGDGKLDMAIPSYSNTLNILLGNGDGTFTATSGVLLGQEANNAVVADFNGDGKIDLAVSLPQGGQVQVLLGNGDGTFTPKPPVSIPNGVSVVATGDLNRDGKADIVVVGYESMVLLGNGDGTFTTGAALPTTPGSFVFAALGDFNRDGILDLAVVNNSGHSAGPGSLTILLGHGDGTFAAVASSPETGVEPGAIATGDFNGDGILDLAVTNLNGGAPSLGTVTVLLGKGDGTFTPSAVSPSTGSCPMSIAVADFNGDGKADLVTANGYSDTATVLLGNGDGTFAPSLSPATGTSPIFGAIGDFNGDGVPDLAVANNMSYSVTVLLTQRVPALR